MIKVQGSHIVERSREELWPVLQDPEILRRCIPGCEEMIRNGDHNYRVRMRVGFGMIKGEFSGIVRLRDMVEPESYVMELRGEGKTGHLHGTTRFLMVAAGSPDRTEIRFDGSVQVGGLLASVGARFFPGAAKSLTEQFFQELDRQVGER